MSSTEAIANQFLETDLNVSAKRTEKLFQILFMIMAGLLILPVLIILTTLVVKGGSMLSFEFLFSNPTNGMTQGGIFPALLGTVWLVGVALVISVPVGVAAAVYLSEYAADNWFTRAINLAIINLAGVPSIVPALFGVGAFVIFFGFGTSILAASMTLAVMTLPVVIVARDPRIAASGAAGVSRSLLEHGCDSLADHTARHPAEFGQRYPNRRNPRSLAHHRGDRANHVYRRRVFHPGFAAGRVRPDHGHVAASVRGLDPSTQRARIAALRRCAGADRDGIANE